LDDCAATNSPVSTTHDSRRHLSCNQQVTSLLTPQSIISPLLVEANDSVHAAYLSTYRSKPPASSSCKLQINSSACVCGCSYWQIFRYVCRSVSPQCEPTPDEIQLFPCTFAALRVDPNCLGLACTVWIVFKSTSPRGISMIDSASTC
jgi:hypothetical protein